MIKFPPSAGVRVNGVGNMVFLAEIRVGERVAHGVGGLAAISVASSRNHGRHIHHFPGATIQTLIKDKDGPDLVKFPRSLRWRV